MRNTTQPLPVIELRVALTTRHYEKLLELYCVGLGLEPNELWTSTDDRALILDMGKATLEIFDERHADVVDQIEVGQRVSGPIRFAMQVPNVDEALQRLLQHGATLVHEPIVTPWKHKNARLQDPDGLHITLYEVL
jgi:methylmalonyl-CoA/ethylmalonyl-CoA epimerase